jgi:hypothetical protein
MERSYIDSGRGIDRPECGRRELSIRLARTATRLVFMVLECAVMVMMPVLGGLFVESGLLDGGMYSP